MPHINYDSVTFEVGDLVKFIGFSYTPDYYEPSDNPDPMGIVIEALTVKGDYITRAWMYRVYWFKSGQVSETVAGHLCLCGPGIAR